MSDDYPNIFQRVFVPALNALFFNVSKNDCAMFICQVEKASAQERLFIAVMEGDPEKIQSEIDAGADPLMPDSRGASVYGAAAKKSAVKSIEYLKDVVGVPIDMVSSVGKTGLYVAMEEAQPKAIISFLENGANPLPFDGHDKNVLLTFVSRMEDKGVARVDEDGYINKHWSPVFEALLSNIFDPALYNDVSDLDEVWNNQIPPAFKHYKSFDGSKSASCAYKEVKARVIGTYCGEDLQSVTSGETVDPSHARAFVPD